jgi:hypothetical protein
MLEGLFLAAAEAVFSYTIEKLEPTEQIKKWLGREPSRLAYQKALARTYTAFARQYPEYVASLFDQSFLTGAGAPELAKLLTRHLHPDPALFAQAWGTSIGFEVHSRFCQEATKPAADFLKWLEAELKSEAVFQPLFDSRALESLSQLENQIEKFTTELRSGLEAALKAAKDYEKIVIQIGGDVKDSNIIIGDHDQISVTNVYHHYYTDRFATLSDYYIPPDAVFQRVRVEEFIGRDWLIAKVDAFLNNPNRKSGAFLLIGEAGVGKTSFMAHLVKERRYLHLFAELVPGDTNLQRALQSLGSQLVTRYQIAPYKDRDTLTQLAAFPDFLDRLLRLAASTLTKDEKIIIVCDALDEAGTFPDGNIFGLPNVLPDHVYFILSQRPANTKVPKLKPHVESFNAQGRENLQDIEDYLRAAAKRPEIAGQIRSKNYNDEFFIRTLKVKSLGVWMYLHHIIEEIESGSRAPLDLENLPTGLIEYYADYWDDWRHGRKGRGEGAKKWNVAYAPLLATLAAAQEQLTIENIIQWSQVNASQHEVRRLFQEDWRAFISERNKNGELLYIPYHASFKDFLTGKVDFTQLSTAQSNLARDLAEHTKEAHKRILKIFHEECKNDLPQWVDQEYPRLHLTTHLAEANEFQILINLLTQGNENIAWAEARYKKEETYAGFLRDLEQIWKYAQRNDNLTLQIRCVLIENSIRSLAGNIPPLLLTELGKSGLWSYARCLAIIKQIPNSRQLADAITELGPHIPKTLLEEILSIAHEIKDEYDRARAFSAIIPHLADELKASVLEEALSAAREIKDEAARASALSAIIPHLPDELKASVLEEALSAAREIKDEAARASALSAIIPHLSNELKASVLEEALSAAREIKDEAARASALSAIIPHLSNELKASVLEEALSTAHEIKDEAARASALSAIIPHLADDLKASVLEEALSAVREIKIESARASTLSAIIPHLADELRASVLEEALSAARKIKNEFARASALSAIIPHLADELRASVLEEALSAVREIKDESARASALSAIIPHLADELKPQTLSAVRQIKDESARARAFSDIIPHLSEDLKPQALSAVREIQDEFDRAYALSDIIPHLSEDLKPQALSAVREIKDESARASALFAIIPHLSEDLKPQALSAAREIKDEAARASALSAIIPYLADDLRASVLEEALSAAREIKNESTRAYVYSKIIPHLSDNLKSQTLSAVREIKDEAARASALSAIIPHLADDLKASALEEALSAVREIKDEAARASALSDIVPHLPEDLKPQALSAAREIKDESARASALSDIIPHLADDLRASVLEEALSTAREIKNESARASTLSNIAIASEAETKFTLLQEVLFMEINEYELNKIIVEWEKFQFKGFREPLIQFLRTISYKDRKEGLSRLTTLLPALVRLEGKKISAEIIRAITDTARWWP